MPHFCFHAYLCRAILSHRLWLCSMTAVRLRFCLCRPVNLGVHIAGVCAVLVEWLCGLCSCVVVVRIAGNLWLLTLSMLLLGWLA